ncbi:MAG: response regulator [Rubrivivax sp.]|nr:response regulator [Rubrivivax sp.]
MGTRARLLLIALLAVAVPALLVVLRFAQDRQNEVRDETAALVSAANRLAEELNDRSQGTAQLLYGLARAGVLQTEDREACSTFLSEVREAYPQYTGIITIRPDGRLFCDSLRSGRELDLKDRAYFKTALTSRGGVILEPVFGRLTGTPVLQVAHPVRSPAGELRFVLLASLNLKLLAASDLRRLPGMQVLLVDRKGSVLASTRADGTAMSGGGSIADSPLFAMASQQALDSADLPGPDGETFRWAVADRRLTAEADLYVLTGAPRSVLVQTANRRFAQDLFGLAIAAVLLFALLWALSEVALRRQISRLSAMARELAAGRLETRIAPPLPRGELGDLMGVMNRTAQALQEQRDDITRLNNRLRQSQRMQAVGQLTGGVAHDFNNLLTVVLGNAELLAEMNADRPDQQALAGMIQQAAQRGAELTQQLLAFARKQPLAPRAVDVNQLLAALDPLLRRTLGAQVEIESVRGAGLWQAQVDPGQLENAVLNLCLNARDAMPGGGRLTLETANASLDRAYTDRYQDLAPGQYVLLAVSDTGEGIAPEHLDQVFEPFFTTKAKGKGTGLGLAMVYGFIKQSAGHVSIYSEPGQGTTVKLYLPRAERLLSAELPAVAEQVVQGGAETILVVEDDELVRRYACNELRSLGYRVLEAEGGAAAMALLSQREDVALLFTDVIMPGMSGRELADAARQLRPAIKLLYTSGYTENAIVHHGRLDPGVHLLAKPYRRMELARAIREALGGAPAA